MLEGLKVLEIAAIGPVPWAGMLLSDMGASVLRIDRPSAAQAGLAARIVGRGRLRLELDLKKPADVERALEFVRRADVLMEGMRPGVMERLGLGPDVCLQAQPALVYARMTGWGQSGPLAQQAGHDINYIALSGALHAIGPAADEAPVPPLNLVGDYGGGGAFLLIGILAALWRARHSGKGEVVDAAMIDGAACLMAPIYARLAEGAWTDKRASNLLDGAAPWYGTYRTSDDKYMAVGAIEPQFYAQLLNGLGIDPDTLPDRASRESWPALRQRFEQAFATRTRDQWCSVFDALDACVSPVLSMQEAPGHPHNIARSAFSLWDGHPVPRIAPRFGVQTEQAAHTAPPPDPGHLHAVWGISE